MAHQHDSDDSSVDEQLSDIGSNLDLSELDRKQIETLNNIGNDYGICPGHFTSYIKSDASEQKQMREDLFLEKQKAISKNKIGTRRERRANKLELKAKQPERQFSRNSPLSFACRESPTYPPPYRDRSASSSSEEPGNIEYITEFGALPRLEAKKKSPRLAKRRRHRRSRSPSRHRRSRSRSQERHRDTYRRRHRVHSSSRSRSRSRSNSRHHSTSRHARERRHSSDRSSSRSLSTGREPEKKYSDTPNTPSLTKMADKVGDQPKLTHFEKMQLKMENKINKQLKQDQKAERARLRAKEAEQEGREDDIREQVRKWRRREKERDMADEDYS